MSKSIYEEALDKTNEFLKSIPNEIITTQMFMRFPLTQITKALEQAQKQEKLLKLYKELATVRDDEYYDMRTMRTYLKQQIEELEND